MTRDVDPSDPIDQARLTWRDGVPIADQFNDPYYSLENGLAETAHVFLGGNDLPGRFRDGFHIAELGFGTGLSLLLTLKTWRAQRVPGVLHFSSFEAFPMWRDDMVASLAAFPTLSPLIEELSPQFGANSITTPDLDFQMVQGDARDTLPAWDGAADAWYLDGFSPAKNPELWGADLMQAVANHTAPSGTFATYTAAGHVRRGLSQAGFHVERIPGYGRKRHMTKGSLI